MSASKPDRGALARMPALATTTAKLLSAWRKRYAISELSIPRVRLPWGTAPTPEMLDHGTGANDQPERLATSLTTHD